MLPVNETTQPVKLGPNAREFGRLCASERPESNGQPAASIAPFGKGKIAATYFGLGQSYLASRSETGRAYLDGLVRQLFPQPLVEVQGSKDVDVAIHRKNGKLAVNLVNTAGPHATEAILQAIPPVGPLTVTIRTAIPVRQVTLEPGGRPLAFKSRTGGIEVTVPEVKIHEIVVVELDRD